MSPFLRRSRVLGPAALALALAAGSACSDPLRVQASLENVTDTLVVYALSDTAAARRDFPTSLSTGNIVVDGGGSAVGRPTLLPTGGDASFDVAFDLDDQRRVVLYPMRRIIIGSATRTVGLQVVGTPFETLAEAPKNGYQFDSVAVTVTPGQTVAIQAQTVTCASTSNFSPYTYSKLVVDSVSAGVPAIHFRIVVDPNCGFRSFSSGVPRR
ncbi:MAG: hypothetical protein ACJ79S_12500 [Gemmatimonadaceae bacterium]